MNNLSAFTTEDTTTMPSKGQSPHPTMPEIKINPNGEIKLLKSIDPHKATGPDNIPAHLYCQKDLGFSSNWRLIISCI
jgi:hypothetical protein